MESVNPANITREPWNKASWSAKRRRSSSKRFGQSAYACKSLGGAGIWLCSIWRSTASFELVI